jgi:hypothetical protein
VAGIDRFIWTDHALLRLRQRRLAIFEVEQAIRQEHDNRKRNAGEADWLIETTTPGGRAFGVIYDHPIRGDRTRAVIISAWSIE